MFVKLFIYENINLDGNYNRQPSVTQCINRVTKINCARTVTVSCDACIEIVVSHAKQNEDRIRQDRYIDRYERVVQVLGVRSISRLQRHGDAKYVVSFTTVFTIVH